MGERVGEAPEEVSKHDDEEESYKDDEQTVKPEHDEEVTGTEDTEDKCS